MWRLLILSCSARKRAAPEAMAAVDRYDGPAFRVLRRYRASALAGCAPVRVFILSAEHGLLTETARIAPYDRRMTAERAAVLAPGVTAAIATAVQGAAGPAPPSDAFVDVGRTYLGALEAALPTIRRHAEVVVAEGAMGARLARLHDWLHGVPPAPRFVSAAGPVWIGGVEFTASADAVLERARTALHAAGAESSRFHAWYVDVDGRRVAPKWLVSTLTGMPVAAFTTERARWVLARFGVEVHRA